MVAVRNSIHNPIRNVVIITKEYPTDTDSSYSFVAQLACGFADAGLSVTVICPLSLTRALKYKRSLPPAYTTELSPGRREVTVIRPRTWSASDGKTLGVDRTMLTYLLFRQAVKRTLSKLPQKPDVLYGHFISLSGLTAAELGVEMGIPSFLGYGESSPKVYASYNKMFLMVTLAKLWGVVSVSSENERELRGQGLLMPSAKVGVFPNAVNSARFRPMDRGETRNALGFDQDAFIVGFVGAFSERKGVGVLSEALGKVPGVQSVFIGRGELAPRCDGVLHQGPLPHDQVPQMLAACDVFVLPTLAEGCCNAIVEALSMGLPVVSSALPFNDDILSDENSIRVDPRSADEVAGAIARLRDDADLCKRLSQGALTSGRELEIGSRVKRILSFMEECTTGK